MAALYLDGLRRPDCSDLSRRRWPTIADTLRRRLPSGATPAAILHNSAYWEEALCLDDADLIGRSIALVMSGKVVTAADSRYPRQWAGLASAPPALWLSGSLSDMPYIGIVGTRNPSRALQLAARQLAEAAVAMGYGVVSGGAIGIDQIALTAAVRSGGSALAILPHGVRYSRRSHWVAHASACPQGAVFDTQRAMQRNAWIYAASDATFVLGPRFRQGGTWHGAAAALRVRRNRVAVLDLADDATRALIQLGGIAFTMEPPTQEVISGVLAQPDCGNLFCAVSESAAAYLG